MEKITRFIGGALFFEATGFLAFQGNQKTKVYAFRKGVIVTNENTARMHGYAHQVNPTAAGDQTAAMSKIILS